MQPNEVKRRGPRLDGSQEALNQDAMDTVLFSVWVVFFSVSAACVFFSFVLFFLAGREAKLSFLLGIGFRALSVYICHMLFICAVATCT